MMKLLSLLMVLIISFSFFSCKKNKTFTDFVPDDLKPYSVFQVGSYWIYLNEQTAITDCTYLKSAPVFSFHYYYSGSKEEVMWADYNGSFIRGVTCNPHYAGSYALNYNMVYDNGGITLISAHISPGYVFKGSYYEFKVLSITDTLNLNNEMYTDVLATQYKMKAYQSLDSIILTFYMAKYFGLIKFNKRVNSTDTTWSLMRSHVLH